MKSNVFTRKITLVTVVLLACLVLLSACGSAPANTADTEEYTAPYEVYETAQETLTIPSAEAFDIPEPPSNEPVQQDTAEIELAGAPMPMMSSNIPLSGREGGSSRAAAANIASPETTTDTVAEVSQADKPDVPDPVDPDGIGNDSGEMKYDTGRKIVLNAEFTLETLEYENTIQMLRTAVAANDGYVSYYNASSPQGYAASAAMVARIPQHRYSSFLQGVEGTGSIISRNEGSTDITQNYVDVEARITALRAQETRLLALMESAGDLSDIITIQNKLTDVQYEIDRNVSTQQTYDDLIAYSTVTIYIQEVREYTPPPPPDPPEELTFWQRLSESFRSSWATARDVTQSIIIGLTAALPLLIFFGIVLFIALFFTRKKRQLYREQRKREKEARLNFMASPPPPPSGYAPAPVAQPDEPADEEPANNPTADQPDEVIELSPDDKSDTKNKK